MTRSVIHLSKKWVNTYLDSLVLSAFSVLWGTVKQFRLKSHRRHTLAGECAGESVTKMHFSASAWKTWANDDSHAHLKSNKAPIYAIKGPETAKGTIFVGYQTGRLFLCTNTIRLKSWNAFSRVLGRTFQCHFRQSVQSYVNLTIKYLSTAFNWGPGASDINAWKIAIWRFSLTFLYRFPEVINSVNFKYRAVKRSGPRQSCIYPNYLHGFIPK